MNSFNMKKEIPILYSTPMVQAILNLSKSMTRRLKGLENINENPNDWAFIGLLHGSIKQKFQPVFRFENTVTRELIDIVCPYGKPSDLLWVREKHRRLIDCETGAFHSWDYYADMSEEFHKQFPHKWKPSIHMPKAAARIWLEVTDVRVERLRDISEEDAISEGAEKEYQVYPERARYRYGFALLWSKINGYESWEANPWVWVVSFRVLSTTGKPEEKQAAKHLV
jgi:hypothetical protein